MQINGHDIGVCSWSLKAADSADLVKLVKSVGLNHVQIALARLVGLDDAAQQREIDTLLNSGLSFTSGMISFRGEDYSTIAATRKTCGYVPDDVWPERRDLSAAAAKLARRMGLNTLTTHVGFVPHPGKHGHDRIVQRVRDVAAILADAGQGLLLETGQESVTELLEFVEELDTATVGVNFDPANVILYGAGDPIAALKMLGRWIRHVHVKDAVASNSPGKEWGSEVPFGTGQVGPVAFLKALRSIAYHGPLIIEREGGDQRAEDIRTAISALQSAAHQ